MAKQTNVNLLPATGAEAIYDLKEFLKTSLSFVVPESSDGTTYNNAADQITSGGAGANGMANANAWFRIQDPDGEYEWTFQRDASNNTDWRIKYSAADGFTGGSPAATQTPSATDEQLLHGAGTDASPTHSVLFQTDGGYRWHLSGFDVGVGAVGNRVYPWFAWAVNSGTANCETFIGQDALATASYPALVGTRAVPATGEPDPSIVFAGHSTSFYQVLWSTSSGGWQASSDGNQAAKTWFAMNGTNGNVEGWGGIDAAGYMYQESFGYSVPGFGATDHVGPDPRDSSDQLYRIFVGRASGRSTRVGPKGILSSLRWMSVQGRAYPDVVDVGGERYCYVGDFAIPFENGVVPL